MLGSIPLQSTILANEAILDPNYNKSSNNMLATVFQALVRSGVMSQGECDKLLMPTPFEELVKKREQELQKQKEQEDLFSDIPSVFEDPMNFNRLDIPDDYFEVRRSGYWNNQKDRDSNEKKLSVVYAPKKPTPLLSSLRERDDTISTSRPPTQAELPICP